MAAAAPTLEFLLQVLTATAFDHCGSLFWRTDGDHAPVTIWVNCSDLFAWAVADLEEITPSNIDELTKAIEDCNETEPGSYWGPMLFAARVRRARPSPACLQQMTEPIRILFMAIATAEPAPQVQGQQP